MKVGILTFPNSTSYGATLQMYALYRTVKKLGHDAEIINYHNAYMKAEKHHEAHGAGTCKRQLKQLVRRVLHARHYSVFKKFERENMLLHPVAAVTDKASLREISMRYDAVICGSDQVWNPDITDTDLSYFLDFCGEGTRRISYAPSFGIDAFSEEFGNIVRPELRKFYALSVREKVGCDYVAELTGRKPTLVTDPTLLVGLEEWRTIETKKNREDPYILYYTVRGSKTLLESCKSLADETGLKIVIVGGNFIGKLKNRDPRIEYVVDISPSEWLGLVHHAEYVVTNSFHGTAFSIIYRKDFYLELSSLTNSRLSQIIEMLGLEDRIVRNGEQIRPSVVEYATAEAKLQQICGESLKFLKNALGEEKQNG